MHAPSSPETAPTAYPLQWPLGYPRTVSHHRLTSKFGTGSMERHKPTIAQGLERVSAQLRAFGHHARATIISTNIPLRKDGLPYAGTPQPADPGAAVYLTLHGKPIVLCCDKWTRLGCNLTAIAHTLEALRGLARWGVTQSERAFTGFAALPAPGEVQARTCWQVLGIAPTTDTLTIQAAWRKLAQLRHPDVPGGSHDAMAELNTARDQALQAAQA